jgi:hypothetical protein
MASAIDSPAPSLPTTSTTHSAKPVAKECVRAALASAHVARGLVTFTDAFGGRVALRRSGRGLQHVGGAAVRGPAAPPASAFLERAPSRAAGRALEFVAAWHGSPFDAANLRLRHGSVLSWGFWDFSGPRLARVLAGCKGRSPDLFAALLGRYGVDVGPAGEGPDGAFESGSPGWDLLVKDDRRVLARGREAAALIAAEPRRLAALARAGRDSGIQLTQVESAVRDAVLPALALHWPAPEGVGTAADALPSARGHSALLSLVLRFGLPTTQRLLSAVAALLRPEVPEFTRLLALARELRRAGAAGAARWILEILASPELGH